jgi:hygromycin-B 4-O-kinase
MTGVKPQVDIGALTARLQQDFGSPVHRLALVEGGGVAQTFSIAVGDLEYIVRLNQQMGANFEKEAFISIRFASPAVPIPRIVHLGRIGTLRYAVSERAPGMPLVALPPGEIAALMPALLNVMDAIHATDVRATTGYGLIGDDGNGRSQSWQSHLESVREEGPEWDYFGRWHALFKTTFLDRASFDRLFAQMAELIRFAPDDRYLVHGDFGFGNVMAEGGRITAVLDWINAAYGDFLYDVARFDFWGAGMDFAGIVRRRYAERGIDVPHFDERIRCYQASVGLDAARFYAKAGDERSYRWLEDRLRALNLAFA